MLDLGAEPPRIILCYVSPPGTNTKKEQRAPPPSFSVWESQVGGCKIASLNLTDQGTKS